MVAHHREVSIYGEKDPLLLPVYSLREAAHHLHLPAATVRSWTAGRSYETRSGTKHFPPIVEMANPQEGLLSFWNLVELHILSSIRRVHQIKLRAVRRAIQFLRKRLGSSRPLIEVKMLTDGKDLFVEQYGELVAVSADGQMAMKKILGAYLQRIERDARGLPIRLFPILTAAEETAAKPIAIDPTIQFGKPCVTGTRIPTSIIAERFAAGDSVESLAEDYELSPQKIQEALQFEQAA